jgi:hypothetical protein
MSTLRAAALAAVLLSCQRADKPTLIRGDDQHSSGLHCEMDAGLTVPDGWEMNYQPAGGGKLITCDCDCSTGHCNLTCRTALLR